MWESHYHQGQSHLANQEPELAILHFQSALAEHEDETLHAALIESYMAAALYDEALQHLQELVKNAPRTLLYASLLGDVYMAQHSYLQAQHIYTQALYQDPRHLMLLQRSARAALATQDHELALAQTRKALSQTPEDLELRLLLADIYQQQKEYKQAASVYEALYAEFPERTDILIQWFQSQAVDDPGQAIQLLIELARRYPALKGQLAVHAASLLRSAGDIEEARKSLEVALADPFLLDKEAYRHLHTLLHANIPASTQSIEAYAERVHQWAEALQSVEQPLVDSDYENLNPYLNLWSVLAFQPYLNIDPLPIRRAFGAYFQSVLPETDTVSPPAREKKRLVFVLNNNSPAHHLMRGLLIHWPDSWEVHVCYTPSAHRSYGVAEAIEAARPEFQSVFLPESPGEALRQMANLRADVLFFSEVHTDQNLQSFLAAHRLAPVQVTSWLSSGTTGLSTIDYYLSTTALEQKGAQKFYSEKLVLLDELPTYFYKPSAPRTVPPRSDYGLPDTGRLYLCPQLMFKLHPDFDQTLAEILETDPEGQLILMARPATPKLQQLLLERFESSFPHLMPRIWFMPMMEPEDLWGLMQLSDVMLDPFYFGGGTTSYEALALGVPIITWPGERLHGRMTYGFYQTIGELSAVAMSPEDYVEKAVYFATHPEANQQLRERILAHNHRLFEQSSAVHHLSETLFKLS